MPSNKDLIESIGKVAAEKGVDMPNIVGLNNDKLYETLKDLRALEVKSIDESENLVPCNEDSNDESTDESENLTPGSEDSNDKSTAQKIKANKEKAEKDKRAEEKAAFKTKQDAIPPYRVADGKAITCKKGVLSDGDEVKAKYLPGGKETLDNLVNRGFVIKK